MYTIIINYYNAKAQIGINEPIKSFETRTDARLYYIKKATHINETAKSDRNWYENATVLLAEKTPTGYAWIEKMYYVPAENKPPIDYDEDENLYNLLELAKQLVG